MLLLFETPNDFGTTVECWIDTRLPQRCERQGFESGTHCILHQLIEDAGLWSLAV